VHKTDSDETFHSVKLHRMVGLNVRKWGFYDKTVKNFKPFCWWDAFRSVWMTQQNAPSASHRVADLQCFNPRTTDVEHPMFALDHVPAVVGVFLTTSKDFFQTFNENICWFDARLHDMFELQSSFQFLGGCSGGTRLLGVANGLRESACICCS
jgi:hypothetical protein